MVFQVVFINIFKWFLLILCLQNPLSVNYHVSIPVMSQSVSLPTGFCDELSAILPPETASGIIAALHTGSPVSIRFNRRKPSADTPVVTSDPVPWCDDGVYLDERPLFTLMPEMHAGAFYVQEAASMIHQLLAERICGGRAMRLLDLCAAPGGKSTAMLNALPDGSTVVANEQSLQRAAVLAENLTKYGYPGTIVTCGDARLFGGMAGLFDLLVADAPCSGEGMMRKEEIARTQWTPGLVASCARLQREILRNTIAALRPGGWLIYSTCTFNIHEDEEISQMLIEELGLTPADVITPEEARDWGLHPALTLSDGTPGHGWRFLPGFTRSEGLYVALFRKPEATDRIDLTSGTPLPERADLRPETKKHKKKDKGGRGATPDFTPCHSWVTDADSMVWQQMPESISVLTPDCAALLPLLPRGTKVVSAGVEVATVKGRDLIPSPQLALSTLLAPGVMSEVDIDRETALRYLRRESIVLPPDVPKGFVLIRHNGLPLGWMKNLGNRANNLWPPYWRIRMQ